MLKITYAGAQYYCDACQRPLVDVHEGVGLFSPLQGPQDAANLFIVHRGCKDEPLVKMLMPQRSARPLADLLAQADEAINR